MAGAQSAPGDAPAGRMRRLDEGKMSIIEFLGLAKKKIEASEPGTESETVRKIVAALDQMDPDRARYIASFAFILCRVARADLKITQTEMREIEHILVKRGKLTEEQAILAAQMAKQQSIFFGGTENFLVTREFNRIATREQKLSLLDCLFSVASADLISTVEENEISKICSELNLSHDDYISTRSAYREYRAVLQKTHKTDGGKTGSDD
jgi:uncharacterized tellurite resistance protein B-like protein